MIPAEVQERGPTAIAIFENVIRKGGKEAYRGAVMLALQQAPKANTSREFNEGLANGRFLDDMGKHRRKRILAGARKAGIDPASKVYKSGLGRPDDPAAWVDSMDDVIRVAKARGKIVEDESGIVYEPPEPPPRKSVPLAPDLVNRFVKQQLDNDPGLAEKVKKKPKLLKEVQASVIDKHAHKKKR